MYEDFRVTDRWTGESLHCRWTANVVAIATRHADAVDVCFDVNERPCCPFFFTNKVNHSFAL